MKIGVVFFIFLLYRVNCDNFTFENVDVQIWKRNSLTSENKHIDFSDRLNNFLPEDVFVVEISKQNIPVLYRGSVSDVQSSLTINCCNVEELKPGAFTDARLIALNLSGNKIKSIDYGVFNNVSIQFLELSSNEISTIHPQAFDDMKSLELIYLNDNKIKVWNSEWFKNSPKIETLHFENNEIKKLPAHAFKNIKGEGWEIVHLIFKNNKIKEIDSEAFTDLKEIYRLDLSNNLLEGFHENLLRNIDINQLYLDNNKISCLFNVADVLKAKWVNSIDSNPMYCDCLDKVKKYARNHPEKNVEFSEIKCKLRHQEFR